MYVCVYVCVWFIFTDRVFNIAIIQHHNQVYYSANSLSIRKSDPSETLLSPLMKKKRSLIQNRSFLFFFSVVGSNPVLFFYFLFWPPVTKRHERIIQGSRRKVRAAARLRNSRTPTGRVRDVCRTATSSRGTQGRQRGPDASAVPPPPQKPHPRPPVRARCTGSAAAGCT